MPKLNIKFSLSLLKVFPTYIDPASGAMVRMAGPTGAGQVPPGLRLIGPGAGGAPLLINGAQGLPGAAQLNLQQQNSLGYGGSNSLGSPSVNSLSGFSAGRRDSMDRQSQSAFSPSLIEQYTKNKAAGWPSYGLGAVTGLGLGSGGSLTPPPSTLAGAALNLFGNRFAGAGAANDRNFPVNARNGVVGGMNLFGSSQNLFPNPNHKARNNSIDKAAANRSRLLEEFR